MRALTLTVLLLAATAAVADQASQKRLVQEGVALFDQGKMPEAIAKYKEALAENPSNTAAAYELALTYTAMSDFAKCRAAVEPVLEIDSPERPFLYEAVGNCLDGSGENAKAVEAYRKGLAVAPDHPSLQFNLAIALASKGSFDEARELLKKEVVTRPGHANGHLILAHTFDQQGFRVPALFEYLRYLVLAPDPARAAGVAGRAVELLNQGVEKKGKNINISVDPHARTEEGDFSVAEMMLAIASASSGMDDAKKKSEAQRLVEQLDVTLAMLIEGKGEGKDFTSQTNIPFFEAMSKRKLVEPFGYVAFASLNQKGSKEWLAKNGSSVEALRKWIADNAPEKAPAVVVPPKP